MKNILNHPLQQFTILIIGAILFTTCTPKESKVPSDESPVKNESSTRKSADQETPAQEVESSEASCLQLLFEIIKDSDYEIDHRVKWDIELKDSLSAVTTIRVFLKDGNISWGWLEVDFDLVEIRDITYDPAHPVKLKIDTEKLLSAKKECLVVEPAEETSEETSEEESLLKQKLEDAYGTEGTLSTFTEPYYVEYTYTHPSFGLDKGLEILKTMLGDENEVAALPDKLPTATSRQSPSENFDLVTKVNLEKEKYTFSFEYPGGVTQGIISKPEEGTGVSVKTSYSAD